MLFNSLRFLIFFPTVTILYFLLPYRHRWALLLVASYYFYMCWKPEYAILLVFSTVIDYYLAIQMGKIAEKPRRRKFLIISIVTNLGLLFVFKYFNFFNKSISSLYNIFDIPYSVSALNVLLPVGISFYTFQALSYTIDVYRGEKAPEKHLGIFALYISYFPQLVAGPIERSTRLLPQLYEKFDFDYLRVTDGLKLMLWGFFKKIVIADRLALFVNPVYGNPHAYNGVGFVMATVFFAFQIYCDFSGYSDIAMGAAKVMGVKLMVNFNRPYFAKSISEFWKRWHISLSTWFKDYLYIPLGGSRVAVPRWYFNLFIVFLISGFWHGASWTFVLWGTIHGFYIIFGIATKKIRAGISESIGLTARPLLHKIVQVATTFTLVCFAWIFFRANSISDAVYIVRNIFTGWSDVLAADTLRKAVLAGNSTAEFVIALWVITLLVLVQFMQRNGSIRQVIAGKPVWARWTLYYGMILCIYFFGKFDAREFIYFQF